MCIFVGNFRFLNSDLGGWGVPIRNQRLRNLPSTEFNPNQITVGILLYPPPAPLFPQEPFLLYFLLLYIKYIIKLLNVYQKIQKRSFKLAIH